MSPARLPRPTDEQLLAFERDHKPGKNDGRKEEDIRRELRITPARYFLLLDRYVHTEEALQQDPMLTNRLRKIARERALERDRRFGTTHR